MPISTVPFCTASSTCSPGTISPAAKTWIWNLLSLISATRLAKYSQPPYSVSSDFGQLVGMRHFTSGIDCAMAGAATAVDGGEPDARGFQEFTTFHGHFPCFKSTLCRRDRMRR